jgi:hypothetical protein
MSQITEDFQHLNNGEVATLLKNHRLVQVHQRGQRFAEIKVPLGDDLIKLASERLIAVVQPAGPAAEPVESYTLEEAQGLFAAVHTLDDLADVVVRVLLVDSPSLDTELLNALVAEAKGRVTDAIVATVQPDPALELAPTAADLVRDFDGITSLDELHTYLARGKEDEVGASLAGLLDRIKASVQPAPAPAVVEEAPAEAQVTDAKPAGKTGKSK